uniref:Uncharacterized protein n=1 Tax=Anguilla anguilla TaxID=7936 RepID=A0A0E9V008_ANGAN
MQCAFLEHCNKKCQCCRRSAIFGYLKKSKIVRTYHIS